MPRVIDHELMIDWNFDGSYTDESARLVAANGTVRLAAPESGITSPRGTVDQCTLTLNNHDGRYSPLNTSSPLYSAIQGGGAYHAPFYLRVRVDTAGSYARVFTGAIKIPRDLPPYPGAAGQVSVDCRSRDEILLNKRLSTPIATFRSYHDNSSTEADIIAGYLTAAGVAPAETVIDPGLFVIPWAWLDDESPVEDIWNLAAACGGRFYCDQDGVFRYENMTHWLFAPHDTSQETILENGYGQMEGPVYNDRELYGAVTVVASPRSFGAQGPLWSPEGTVVVGPGATTRLTAKMRQPAYQISGLSFTAVSAGGSNLSGSIATAMTQYAQRVEITLTNTHSTYAAELVDMAILGVPVDGGPVIEEARTSAASFWTAYPSARPGRTRLVRGNVYVQTQSQAAALAEFLRDRYEQPRLTWTLRNVPGNPVRRLGDRITVGNSQVMTANRQGFITSIAWRLSEMGFIQDLEVMDAADLYTYGNPGDDGYFEIGVNTLGSGGGTNAHIFY